MITLDRLKYFSEVAKLEHLGNAAKSLNISPSVLSSAIKVLEQELKCKLFVRKNNSIKLNENGYLLLEKSAAILNGVELLYDDIGTKNFLIKGHYRIGASPFLMKKYLINAFNEVKAKNPDLTVELLSIDTGEAISQVLSGGLDMALVFRSIQHQNIFEEVIYEGDFKIAVKKNHKILKVNKNKRVELLNTLPAITFRTSQGPNFCESHPVFKEYEIHPKHTYFYQDNNTSLEILKQTQGWALLPDVVIESNSNSIKPLIIDKKWRAPLKISFVTSKNNKASMLFESLLESLQKKLIRKV